MSRPDGAVWPLLRAWLVAAEEALRHAAPALDALNVFPVPDADTGENLHGTLVAAATTATRQPDQADPGDAMAACGAAALRAARGNSGTLLAVALTGMAEPLRGARDLDVAVLGTCLVGAERHARSALAEPREGTLLTVLGAVARHAERTDLTARPVELSTEVAAWVDTARDAVRLTEAQLEPLRRAGVVDAGAVGLLWVLEALRAVVAGEEVRTGLADSLHGYEAGTSRAASSTAPTADPASADVGVEVMCLLELTPLEAGTLRQRLLGEADSVILAPVGSVTTPEQACSWRVHFHTSDEETGRALLADAGPAQELTFTDLAGPRSRPAAHDEDHARHC